jgi:hypothetical protein
MAIDLRSILPLLLPLAAQATDLSGLSWGLHNEGESQQILIDHYTSGVIEGVAGEDIRPIRADSLPRIPVVVAVLDTGVDESHPALSGSLMLPGFNAIDGSSKVKDSHGHGTHVSGIIAGRRTDRGFEGVSRHAFILPIRVIQSGPNAPIRPQELEGAAGTALTENVAKGIHHAIERGAHIIHLSLAWPASIRSKSVDDSIALAEKKGVLVVASAGNDSTHAMVYPCLYASVICVGAHGPDGAFTHFSNHGPMVDILAPGVSILSAWPLSKNPVMFAGQTGYEFRNGTSMAAPFVTGALAELISLGIPPNEAKNRLFLSSRSTRTTSLFRTELGRLSGERPDPVRKQSRFGNLDLERAVSLKPAPLIVPARKDPVSVDWRGKSRTESLVIPWINLWTEAHDVEILVAGRRFPFKRIRTGERVRVSLDIPVSKDSESQLLLPAKVMIKGREEVTFSIPVSLVHVIEENAIPEAAIIHAFPDFRPTETMSIRSVIPVAPLTTHGHLFLEDESSGLKAHLLAKGNRPRSALLKGRRSADLLNWYALPDGSFQALFAIESDADSRPFFQFVRLDPELREVGETRLGTETTVFPENFRFVLSDGAYLPHFISHGFTPKPDLPPFDPWNPEFRDERRMRFYRLGADGLRVIPLEASETPLLFLESDSVIVSSGSGYLQTYRILTFKDGRVLERKDLELPAYRLLAGLVETRPAIPLDGSSPDRLFLVGRSSPGNLRISSISRNAPGTFGTDRILAAPSSLDSLMGVAGVFMNGGKASFFAESHYDLIYLPADGTRPFSSSLNRYSYIPSMITSKNLFPVPVARGYGKPSLPGIYSPASLLTDQISEIRIADPDARRILTPLEFRMRAGGSCRSIGNLLPDESGGKSRIAFWCGEKLVEIPIRIRE